jgi:hypothetical protein
MEDDTQQDNTGAAVLNLILARNEALASKLTQVQMAYSQLKAQAKQMEEEFLDQLRQRDEYIADLKADSEAQVMVIDEPRQPDDIVGWDGNGSPTCERS